MSDQIKKIVILGRDADAWLTALMSMLAFSRLNEGIEIELVELPTNITVHDSITTLPSMKALHDSLGLDERKLLNISSGMYSFGQRFSNWSGAAPPFIHAYDTQGAKINDVDFLQYWIKAQSLGLNVPLENFSLGAVAAKQGCFVLHNGNSRSFSSATKGYNFSALEYISTIAKSAKSLGVKHKQAPGVNLRKNDKGMLEALILPGGEEVQGDFFIDATGDQALLIKQMEDNNYESWKDWFIADKLLVAKANELKPLPAYSQVSAFSYGWVSICPLLGKSAVTAMFASEYGTEEDTINAISVISGMKMEDVVLTDFEAGKRKNAWVGNCLAVGESFAKLEPMDASQLRMLHLGLSNLVSLFPRTKNIMPESAVYNRKMNAYVENIRDFQSAHYKLNKRYREYFWARCRDIAEPESLQHKIELFSKTGKIARYEDETFFDENWAAIFVGHGLIPKSYSPLVDGIGEQEQIQHFQAMLKYIGELVGEMPSMDSYMELHI